jgi:hypothetical protein
MATSSSPKSIAASRVETLFMLMMSLSQQICPVTERQPALTLMETLILTRQPA